MADSEINQGITRKVKICTEIFFVSRTSFICC